MASLPPHLFFIINHTCMDIELSLFMLVWFRQPVSSHLWELSHFPLLTNLYILGDYAVRWGISIISK